MLKQVYEIINEHRDKIEKRLNEHYTGKDEFIGNGAEIYKRAQKEAYDIVLTMLAVVLDKDFVNIKRSDRKWKFH